MAAGCPATPPFSDPDGDINDDSAIDVLDAQLAVNIFLGTEVNATLVDRADVRCCNDGYISVKTIQYCTDVFLTGWS